MDPIEALEWQRDLLEHVSDPAWHDYLTYFVKNWHQTPWPTSQQDDTRATKTQAVMRIAAMTGETYAVDNEMMDLVRYAAESLPDDTVHRWTMPSEFGFALFPGTETYGADDVNFRTQPVTVRALLWSTFNDAVHLFFLSDNDDLEMRGRATFGRMTLGHVQTVPFGQHIRTDQMLAWSTEHDRYIEVNDPESVRMLMTPLAFWHLCQQTIATSTPVDVPRHAVKRWRRAGGIDNHVVRVVRLRRRSGPAPEGEGREWHHRWIVRGHWRQQPCGPGKTLTRPVWIAPYVKGPEDAPLLDSTKINYLVR